MSDEELKAELERLRKENEALKKGAFSGIRTENALAGLMQRGLATRSRAALGINPSALLPGREVHSLDWDRQGRGKPVIRTGRVPGSHGLRLSPLRKTPWEENRGGTPTVVRLTFEARPCPSARQNTQLRLSAFRLRISFLAWRRPKKQAPPLRFVFSACFVFIARMRRRIARTRLRTCNPSS